MATKADVTTEPIQLTEFERMAAIRAYNTTTKHELTRAQMVDHIIAAINEEREADDASTR